MYPSPDTLRYGPYPPAPPPAAPTSAPLQRQPSVGPATRWLKLADEFRLDPLVNLGNLGQQPNLPQRQFDFTYEKQVLEDCTVSFADMLLESVPVEELGGQHPTAAGLAQMGFTPAAAYLAVALYGSRTDQDKVVEFCKNYQQLTAMGFDAVHVVGALQKTNNDANAAVAELT